MTTANNRTADYSIDPMFLERWSRLAFSGEPISEPAGLHELHVPRRLVLPIPRSGPQDSIAA